MNARIERASLAAWPALDTVRDGDWLWLFANGYTKRANSIRSLSVLDDGQAEERISRLAQLSRMRGIVPVFRVTELTGPGTTAALDRLGWSRFDDSLVLARNLCGGEDGPPETGRLRLEVEAAAAVRFLDAQTRLQGYSKPVRDTLAAMAGQMSAGKGLTLRDAEGNPLCSTLVVVADGVAHITNVITAADHRRKGLAQLLLKATLHEAWHLGADLACLAVLGSNQGARKLYARSGFDEVGRYHYRKES